MESTKQEKQTSGHYLAANLRFLRKRKKLSQEELASQIGLNRGNIASYENGSAEPRITNLLRMAEFFGISLIDLAQRDLTAPDATDSLARIQGLCPQERARLEGLFQKAVDFEQFLQGINTCFCYKTKDLDHDQTKEVPQIAKFLRSHFEQLHAAACKLSQEHLQLLRMCRVKEDDKPSS